MSGLLGAALAGFTGGMAGAAKGRLDTEAADAAKSKHMIDENHLAEQRAIMVAEMQDFYNDENANVEDGRKVKAADLDKKHDIDLANIQGKHALAASNARGANDKQLTALAVEDKKREMDNKQEVREVSAKIEDVKLKRASGIEIPDSILNALISKYNSLTGGHSTTTKSKENEFGEVETETVSKRMPGGFSAGGAGGGVINYKNYMKK